MSNVSSRSYYFKLWVNGGGNYAALKKVLLLISSTIEISVIGSKR